MAHGPKAPDLTSQERADTVNALHFKAKADRKVAEESGALRADYPDDGVKSMARTLVAQADRAEKLADELEE